MDETQDIHRPQVALAVPRFLQGIDIPSQNITTHAPNPLSGVSRVEVRLGRAGTESDTGPDGYYRPHPKLEITRVLAGPDSVAQYPAMDSTSNYLNEHTEEYTEVGVGNYGFSDGDMASFGFLHCDAVVMRCPDPAMGGFRGFAHITSGADPTEYIDNLTALFGAKNLEAIVIRTEGDLGGKLLQALRDRGVLVLKSYDTPTRESSADNHSTAYSKDVIVRPEFGKVIVNIEGTGLREIDF